MFNFIKNSIYKLINFFSQFYTESTKNVTFSVLSHFLLYSVKIDFNFRYWNYLQVSYFCGHVHEFMATML